MFASHGRTQLPSIESVTYHARLAWMTKTTKIHYLSIVLNVKDSSNTLEQIEIVSQFWVVIHSVERVQINISEYRP
jgi:hypothetical protein